MLLLQNKFDEAINCYTEALQEREEDLHNIYDIYNTLGWLYEQKGDDALAEFNYRKSLTLKPDYELVRNNLGKVLLKQGKLDEAAECFNELLRQKKDSAELHYNLAVVLCLQGKYDDAIKYFTKVLELNPKYPDAHYGIGAALLAAGRASEAVPNLNEALQTSTNVAEVYIKLGVAYMQMSKYEFAIQQFNKALELKSDRIEVLNYLSRLLATVGKVSIQDAVRAIELAGRACELTGYKNPEFLDTLAVAYAAAGRFDDAVKIAQQAIDVAKAIGQEDLCSEIRRRLELYKAGQPYRQK
jgi:Flp pilus assembly protein TadD